MIRNWKTWALGAFVIFYLLTNPIGADRAVHTILGGLRSAGESLSTFVNGL